jgi:flagellar basal-body rod protein FlgF
MDSGYYAASAGLSAQFQALELVAHNLANLGTTGYRSERATFRSLVAGASMGISGNPLNAALNNFGFMGDSHIDLTSGSLVATGNPLDLSVAGEGFFVVQSGNNEVYTRDGSFRLSSAGQLLTARGEAVLGEQGPIILPQGSISVSGDGTISVDGAVAAKLRLSEFSPGANLQALGGGLYLAPKGAALVPAASSVREGMLEQSNASPVESVVQLITVQRSAEMMQRALSIFDSQFNQTAVQDLPRV